MLIQEHGYALPVSKALIAILKTQLESIENSPSAFVVLNFRDPDYSPLRGGYHPVEIAVDGQGRIQYLTDFAYVGRGDGAELAKELDFDFALGLFQHLGREFPIHRGRGLFKLWQSNFVSYYQGGVYDVDMVRC